jgi:membrane-associated phospholipid phosphatase
MRLWCGGGLAGLLVAAVAGCGAARTPVTQELTVRDAIEHYRVEHVAELTAAAEQARRPVAYPVAALLPAVNVPADSPMLLGTLAWDDEPPTSQPDAPRALVPEGYWRKDVWHQMGHEAKALGGHDFWRGFKTTYWDLENALVLTATMGASVAIRETGVDDAVRRRTLGHRQLGDFDEPIQLLGHPGTHFAATGVLWLTSTLLEDEREHEVAKSLAQALAVNGVSTLLLKGAANTRTPDGERHGWPSGHTSSAFTVAAVLNEYYGPWVGVPSLAMAGLVGYQRLDSRVHDFSDVVFGAVLGYVVGTSIARDNKAEFPELFGMKVIPYADPATGTTGVALMKQW